MRSMTVNRAMWVRWILLGGVAVGMGARADAADWREWHGPNRDLISEEGGWKADRIKEVWRAEVGVGFSSVSVAAGKVYTMGNVGGEDIVWCFDETTGKVLWSHKYACKVGQHKGPRATPTVDGDRVYTLSQEGDLFCLNVADGKVLWDADIKKLLKANQTKYNWGFACSPLVRGDHLILDVGPIAALDKKTGKKIWDTGSAEAGFSSPRLMKDGTKEYVLGFNAEGLLVVDANGGKKVDEYEWETQYQVNSATPIPSGDKIFISSGYGRGCALLRLENGKLKKVYENKEMKNHCNSSVLYKGHLYGFDGQQGARGSLKCMDFETGEVKWASPPAKIGSLMVADGKIIAMLDGGELLIAEADPGAFKEISRKSVLSGQCWTYPVLANGRIFCRSNEGATLVCLGAGG